MKNKTFLIEIGTENLPSKNLYLISKNFFNIIKNELNSENIKYEKIIHFCTSRRLAIQIKGLNDKQYDKNLIIRGPSIKNSFNKNGTPNKNIIQWIKHNSINIKKISSIKKKNKEWYIYTKKIKGEKTINLILNIIKKSIKKLLLNKKMTWGDNSIFFIRPVRSITIMFDNELINSTLLGIKSNRIIFGHHFMCKRHIYLDNANNYENLLLDKGYVIANFNKRKKYIYNNIKKNINLQITNIDIDNKLLEEITSLVEWPIVLLGNFNIKYLKIPHEIISYILKNYQKCFPLYKNNKLLNKFIFIINIKSIFTKKIIIQNEQVINSRLNDIQYFLKLDRKYKLESYLYKLNTLIFHNTLGTMLDKSYRIENLSGIIAKLINININISKRAGLLSKCDLVTNMVTEFTGIQGIIGMYYAIYDKEIYDISLAQKEHYQPRYSGDNIPSNLISCVVSIADKIDTLVGLFGINKIPNGNNDFFGLRRNAIGIIRIIIEKKLFLNLKNIINISKNLYTNKFVNIFTENNVFNFIINRYKIWSIERGYNKQIIQSILNLNINKLIDIEYRIIALTKFYHLKEFKLLINCYKRIKKILNKNINLINNNIEINLIITPLEKKIINIIKIIELKIDIFIKKNNYFYALKRILKFKILINFIFKNMKIINDNKKLTQNRLNILNYINNIFNKISDFSIL